MRNRDHFVDGKELLSQARSCLARAYAPYSKFPVAAAVLDDHGNLFTGVNVENASYGLTICAERVAIFAAIAAGARKIVAVAVAAKEFHRITPCGACRQVMVEFCDATTPVFLDEGDGTYTESTVGTLLPEAFVPECLKKGTSGSLN